MKKIVLILCLIFAYQTAYAKDTCKQIPIKIKQQGNILFNMEECTVSKPQKNMYEHILQTELNNPEINSSKELKSKIDLMLTYEKNTYNTKRSNERILLDNNGPLRYFNHFLLRESSKNKIYLYSFIDNKTYIKVEKYSPEVDYKYTDNVHEYGNSGFINAYLFKNAKMDDVYTFVMKNIYFFLYLNKDTNDYKEIFPKAVDVMKSNYFNKKEYLIPVYDNRYNIKVTRDDNTIFIDNNGNFMFSLQKKGNDIQLLFSSGTAFYQTIFNF